MKCVSEGLHFIEIGCFAWLEIMIICVIVSLRFF